ncbi:MAG: hypothetical protein FJ030_01180 [Chloroflexi bacterium]|nr:hypothetical protein [Chloroflexota bacterium]
MNTSSHLTRSWPHVALLIAALASLVIYSASTFDSPGKAKQLRRSGVIFNQVVAAAPLGPVTVPPPRPSGFAPQTRLGFTSGDQ